jgi:hypothetical protein
VTLGKTDGGRMFTIPGMPWRDHGMFLAAVLVMMAGSSPAMTSGGDLHNFVMPRLDRGILLPAALVMMAGSSPAMTGGGRWLDHGIL